MQSNRREVLARERRWAMPAGLAALGAVGFVIVSIIVASQSIGGAGGESEYLRNVDAHQTARLIAGVLQAIGIALLAIPLSYLFRAADARSERMRSQLIGIGVAAPLFLAVASVLTGIAAVHAANDFVTDQVPRLLAKGVELGSDRANEVATETTNDASLRSLAALFGIGGQIGFVVAMVYTALHAMRTGLLTRFWGSLGIALGVVSFFSIFFQFALLWFVYLGLLIAGWVPGGRPPAWAAGKAIPWPTPGERAAAELESGEDENADEPGEPDEKRKRKQRT